MKVLKTSLALLVIILSASCATSQHSASKFQHLTAKELLQQGEDNLRRGHHREATKYFESIDALYPFHSEAKKGQLLTIYAYYKLGDNSSAKAAANRYIHLNPTDRYTDYAYYMKGLVSFYANRTALQKLLSRNLANLDLVSLNEAFTSFSELVDKYPQSPYAKDAEKRMFYIRNLIAEHELSTAKFYLERKAYVAAANRCVYLIRHFSTTPQVREALEMLSTIYTILDLKGPRGDILAIYRLNYPQKLSSP